MLYLSEILPKWPKWIDFTETTDFNEIKEITYFKQFLWNNALTRTFQMNRFSRDWLLHTNQISKELYHSVHLSEKWTKWTDFNEITEINEIKEISDFTQFSKESLLPFGVLAWNFIYISKMNRFNRFYWKISIIFNVLVYQLCLVTWYSGKSIPNLKSTRSPEQTEEIAYLLTFLENQYPASVEPLWKFTQLLCVFCN